MIRALAAALLTSSCLAGVAAAAGPTEVTRGYHLYGRYCIACHGLASSGAIGAAPLRAQRQQQVAAPKLGGVGALAADFYLRTGYMPLPRAGMQPRRARVLFTESEIRALVAYVASLGKGPPIPTPHPDRGSLAQGFKAFTDHCAGCHQVVAAGGYLTGAVPPTLDQATATQVAEAVRIGPNVMPRFSEKAISDSELDSIIRYVQYAKHPDDRGGWALGHVGPIPEGIVTWLIGTAALLAICLVIGTRLRSHEG